MEKPNRYYFFPEQVERGEPEKLIKFLLDQSKRESDSDDKNCFYNEIHVYQEDDAVLVEWTQHFFDEDYNDGSFEFIDTEHVVMKELRLPDNSYIYIHDYEEEEVLKDWLKDHPTWVKDEWGRWYDKEEKERDQKNWEELLKKEREGKDGD